MPKTRLHVQMLGYLGPVRKLPDQDPATLVWLSLQDSGPRTDPENPRGLIIELNINPKKLSPRALRLIETAVEDALRDYCSKRNAVLVVEQALVYPQPTENLGLVGEKPPIHRFKPKL